MVTKGQVPEDRPDADKPTRRVSPSTTGADESQSSDPPKSATDPLRAAGPHSTVPASPTVFGRYEVRRILGSGGFGNVYLGYDTQLDRQVAIKVMHAESADLPAKAEQALSEARKLARLRHPGIVTVHDVGVHEGQVYIVSDYLDGVHLGRWLQQNRPSWAEAVRIVAAVADALGHAHARLVVHRDVKPANIIFTSNREPVLVDFGLALDEQQAGATSKGAIFGTPWYMSPEHAQGTAHRIDGRTDIYSLGVVFYELLTGRVPFRASNFNELLRQICYDEPQPPRQVAGDVPPDVERACLKALAKQQRDRYTTAGDFADDLRRALPASSASAIAGQVLSEQLPNTRRAESPASIPSYEGDVATLRSVRRMRDAERRQLTVLVCGSDLFDSEAYLERDPEDQTRVLREFQRACGDAVSRYNGTILECNEKGLLLCFGFPTAYEDAAGRAVRTGLALLEDLQKFGERLRREDDLDLNPWIAIHTGSAVAESKEGTVSVIGDAVNVTVRLKELAAPGQVICTEATQRMLQSRFECSTIGRQKIKGVPQPVELFRVERVAWTRSPIESVAPAELSPLMGRDQEIGLLKHRWEQAQEGMGQIVLLIGEPGLGKSRLVYTMKQHVLGQMVEGETDAPVIEWRCSPHYQNTEFYPAIDFYERALGANREEPAEDRFERLLYRLQEYGLARPLTVPLWASLLSLPVPDSFDPLDLSPVRRREETFRIMLEWLHTRAARKPILFIIEDLHWVDASTLEFLRRFLAEGLQDSILTLLTFRPEFKTPWPAVAHQTGLALNRLTRRQVGELMQKKIGSVPPKAIVDQIYDRTAGVPLFVEEFTKMIQESGAQNKEGSLGARQELLLDREIPATLQDLVMARLDRMEGERELAQLAATLGREVSYDLLAAVAGVEEQVLQAELMKLVQAEILYPKGKPPRCSYTFKHALLEGAAYNSLVKRKRQEFHRRIAQALESDFPQTVDGRPELLAHHLTEAGLAKQAVSYWLKAGLRSKDRSANVEAIGHLTKGLALVGKFSPSNERDAQELQFLTALGPTYIAACGYAAPEVGPTLQRAQDLCRSIGDLGQMFGIMLGIWEWRIVRADLRVCAELAAQGIELASQQEDPGMLMEGLFMPGVTMFYRAQFAGARTHYEEALASYDNRERTKFWTAYTGHNAGVTHRCYLALTLWQLGYPDQAFKMASEACDLARAISHQFSLCHAIDFAAILYYYSRLGTEMLAAAEEELAIGAEQGFPLWHALGILHKGSAMCLEGRESDGVPLLLEGLKAFRGTGAEIRVPWYLGMVADVHMRAARFHDARSALSEALEIVEENDDRCHEAELHRLEGELHLAESDDEIAAQERFQTAIDIARRQQSRGWELRATMSLARLRQRQGRSSEAREALAAVYATYTEGFTTPDLVDCRNLLDALATGL